ncbi:hypothetical protein BU26DRAFT_264354 [Trematosphaeria pertusa]|uniref:Uncharacterized protein n=1 Tax=Trematosphaeria pertusa TaxID=390896 RepID=A0A6A6IIU6_9PLEO|nr:uncharacterized protein BU26DRAFT_264354 [Trematosphaeria pertusa]KAF2250494.1 hypothetical protein BU26DRAFT_264354 [Trematosphaeria pertusa]
MEPAREAPWAEHEKVYLLAEVLKAAPVPSHVLFDLIRNSNIQPRWNEMALPQGKCDPGATGKAQDARLPSFQAAPTTVSGRSLRSCQMAYDNLAATYSAADYRRPPLPAPIMYPGPDMPKKRPHQPETPPIGRLLQPRPPQPYAGEYIVGPNPYTTAAMSPVGEPASKKKRGRPTKAEAQQKAQEAAARGEVYPPPRKSRPSVTASEPARGERSSLGSIGQSPPSAVPTAPGGAMTPQQTQPEQGPESSSGKKKRGKPTPLELEKSQRAPSETESPLAFGSAADPSRSQAYSSFTPISAPLPSSTEPRDRDRDRDVRMEGVEESQPQPRTTTPHSFKDTVGI